MLVFVDLQAVQSNAHAHSNSNSSSPLIFIGMGRYSCTYPMPSEETKGTDRAETGLAHQTFSMLIYLLALLIPFQFALMLQYYPVSPTETIMAGFTVGIMATVYFLKTRSLSTHRHKSILGVLTHPIVRGIYLILGATSVVFAFVMGVSQPMSFLVVLLIFGVAVALIYWYLFRAAARSG